VHPSPCLTDFAGDSEDVLAKPVRVPHAVSPPVPEDHETVGRSDAIVLFDEEEVRPELILVPRLEPPSRFPFFGDDRLPSPHDAIGAAYESVAFRKEGDVVECHRGTAEQAFPATGG
jgi:hypothetical protein